MKTSVSRFAARTDVPAERSRSEIERTLAGYGADGFGYARDGDRAMIGFRMLGRSVRFVLPLPTLDDVEIKIAPGGRQRSRDQANAALDQETRRRWRALALAIKAKLEAVASGISIFDDEFMPHLIMPDGRTFGDTVRERMVEAIEGRGDVPLIPDYSKENRG